MLNVIEETATRLLEQDPGAVVRHRLLRDVLCRAADDPDLRQAEADLAHSRWVRELAAEQGADGGWGAFHSRSTRAKQKIASTEVGVERALALGLSRDHPILQNAAYYIVEIMQGKRRFPDYHEKNDRWPTGMRLFLAATLSQIQPDHPLLAADRALWHEIARRTFQSGGYREADEIQAHVELTGATVQGSYLVLRGRYQLSILGSSPGTLSPDLEMQLLRWLWGRPEGIGYLGMPLNSPPPPRPGPIDRWLASLELLAGRFPTWVHFAGPSIAWIWEQPDEHGCWDLGPKPVSSPFLPYSDDWRHSQDRRADWTARILSLLRQYYAHD